MRSWNGVVRIIGCGLPWPTDDMVPAIGRLRNIGVSCRHGPHDRRTPARRDRRRRARVARRKGLAATTVRDVASEMGTSSGLIHHYFETMDDVLAAAFERVAGEDLDADRGAVRRRRRIPIGPRRVPQLLRARSTRTGRSSSGWMRGRRPPGGPRCGRRRAASTWPGRRCWNGRSEPGSRPACSSAPTRRRRLADPVARRRARAPGRRPREHRRSSGHARLGLHRRRARAASSRSARSAPPQRLRSEREALREVARRRVARRAGVPVDRRAPRGPRPGNRRRPGSPSRTDGSRTRVSAARSCPR